jgi:hypothetical protein
VIKIQDGDKVLEVTIERGYCSCLIPGCHHLQYAKLVASNSKANLFTLLSATHKCIRQGRTDEALHFAGLVVSRYGAEIVTRYIQKIFFEESRCTQMFLYLGSNWWTDVSIICAAPKKWERVGLFPQTARKAHAYLEAIKAPNSQISARQLLNHQDYYAALADILRIKIAKYSKAQKTHLAKQLFDFLPRSLPSREALQKTGFKLHGYLIWAALEEFYNLHPSQSFQISPISELPAATCTLLLPPTSTYDNHTYAGLALMKRHWSLIQPGKSLPIGLDLRFTGATFGCCFRENAFRQFGHDFVNVPWEQVAIDPHEWRLSLKFNSLYYPEFHRKVSPEIMDWDGRPAGIIDKLKSNKMDPPHTEMRIP